MLRRLREIRHHPNDEIPLCQSLLAVVGEAAGAGAEAAVEAEARAEAWRKWLARPLLHRRMRSKLRKPL